MNDFTAAAELLKQQQTGAVSPLARAAETMKAQQAGQVGMALTYDERDPDAEAKSRQVGAALGINPVVVGADPEAYDLQLRMKQAADGLRRAPKTAAWLADRENGVLAKDDLDNLTWWERVLNAPAQGFVEMGDAAEGSAAGRMIERGVRRIPMAGDVLSVQGTSARIADVGRSLDDLIAEELAQVGGDSAPAPMRSMALMAAQVRFDAARDLSPEDVRRLLDRGSAALLSARERSDKIASIPMSGPATAFRDETLANAEDTFLGALGAFASDPIRGAAFAAEVAGEFLPAILGASAVTVVTRSPAAGALTLGTVSGLTENAASTMEFLAERGVRMETPEDAMAALQDADLMQAARDRGLTRGLVIGMMDAISGGVAGKTLMKSPAGDMIAQGLAQVGLGGGGEALGQLASGQNVSWKDIVIEGLAELVTAPIEVIGVGGRRLLRGAVKAGTAGETAETLAEADAQAAASRLKVRAPEKFREALEAQGLGDKTIHVPADALREYFQAKDVAFDEDTMRAWGIDPVTFEEAAQSGNAVAVPMSNYATYIAGTDAAAWFAENATTDPEELSLAEVRAFNMRVQDIMQDAFEEAEAARLDQDATRAADVQIYDDMFSQLREAGRSPDAARQEATMWAAFWRTMGERYGEDPLDMSRDMPVRVRGPQSPEFRRRDALDIALNTLRTKGEKALKPRGLSLAEFVKAKGGVQDAGGDVAAMDAPKGVVAETAEEMKARASQPSLGGVMPAEGRGLSLDEMGRLAAEAGYFPDLMGDVNLGTKGEASDFAARLLDALSEDVAGRKVYAEGDGPDPAMQALAEALSERGIDIATATNDEIAAALEDAGGQTRYQPGVDEYGYRGDHRAPVKEPGATMDNLSAIFPDDIYGPNAVRYYGTYDNPAMDMESLDVIRRARGDPFKSVIIYRAVPKAETGATINPGDWVTTSRMYAVEHGEAHLNGKYRILKKQVRAADLTTDGNSIHEWGWVPRANANGGFVKPRLKRLGETDADFRKRAESERAAGNVEEYGSEDGSREMFQSAPLKTDTPEFRAWFGDSKVVDENGEPLVVYHSTDADFEAFSLRRGGERTKAVGGDEGSVPMSKIGFWASDEDVSGQMGAGTVMPLYMAIENPRVIRLYDLFDLANEAGSAAKLKRMFTDEGYDGLKVDDDEFGGWSYVAFRPEQIKSVYNRGTFNPNDPRILYQPAYHGSPHIFDRFSLDKIGTGEGAQAFGWGLYFAGRKGVAKFYRDKLAGDKAIDLNGQTVGGGYAADKALAAMKSAVPLSATDFVSGQETYKYYSDVLRSDAVHALTNLDRQFNGMSPAEAVRKVFDDRFRVDPPYDDEAPSATKMADAIVDYLNTNASVTTPGRLYKVDIPEDSDLLAWDAPLSEQSEKVRAALESLGFDVPTPEDAGRLKEMIAEGDRMAKDRDPKTNRMNREKEWLALANERDALAQRLAMSGQQAYYALGRKLVNADDWGKPGKLADRLASEALRAAGIPGHRFLDQGSRGQGDGSYNYVIYDDSAVSVLEFEQGKRGSIVLPSGGLGNGQTVINLFESADLSTLIHESGHFFLEAFSALASTPEASQSMRDDLATIRDFLGVKDGESLTTEQHEQWARGFEAYVMEGKAPSLALADAFARFKAWLTRIYRTARGLKVNITPEIREVMDRMLATDAEIKAAREEQAMRPLFADAPPGMSKTDFTTYQRMARRAVDQAEQSLMARVMAKVRRERETWYRAEKKAVLAEVTADVERRREYRLVDLLANQVWHGAVDGAEIPDMQIDRKALVEQFGDGVLAEVSRQRFGGRRAIYGDNGAAPEEVAQFFGFASAAEMVRTLQNAPRKRDAIAAEVERRMVERHGDPLNDGTIEEEALAAIHSEQQANLSVTEARHMARRLGRDTAGMTAKIYRRRAREMVGRMMVRDVIRPERFLASERKAARAAQDAFATVARGTGKAEQALAEALQAKEQQILNGFIYDEARKVAEYVQKGREKMRAYSKKSVREKLDGGYIEQIDAILEDYDFRIRGQRQIARAESLKTFVDRMIEEGREGELNVDARLIDAVNRRHYTKLSVDELRGLFDTVANIDHMGRFKQRLADRKRKRELQASADRVAGLIRKNLGTGKAGERHRIAEAFNLLWRIDTLLIRMDGGEELGGAYDEIKRSIDEATSEEHRMNVEMAERLDALFKSHYSAADIRRMKSERDIPGANDRAWSKLEILAVALNTGNEDNYLRLIAPDAAMKNRLTKAQVDVLLATMDENDWRFVQDMWDMVNSYWSGLAEVAHRRTGVVPKKVEAKLMVGAPSFVTGGYYPISYDPTLSAAAAADESSAWDKFTATGRGATAAIRNGMTKQRAKSGGGRTLRLDVSVAFAHMRDTIRYIALSEAVDNTYRLISHRDVQNAFLDAGAKDQHDILKLWLKDVAKGPSPSPDAFNTMFRIIKNNFTLSRLALNFKTVALQVTGVGQSAVVIGKRNMIRGYLEYLKSPRGTAAAVVARSVFMRERRSTFQKDIHDFMDDTQLAGPVASGYKKGKAVVGKIGFAPIVWTQFWAVDMPTWLGAFRSGVEKFGDEGKAAHYADRMVARAQDSGMMADRAAFERGTLSETTRQADVVRFFTTLGGYMLTKMNRAHVEAMRARIGWRDADAGSQRVGVVLTAATNLALLYWTEAILTALLWSALSDDDDDDDLKGFLLRETGSAVVGGIPIIRDVYSALTGFGGGGIYGSVADAPARLLTQAAQGENDAALRRAIADSVGMITGLPTTGPMRAIEGALSEDVPLSEALLGRNPLAR